MTYVLDTHTLLWYLSGTMGLGPKARAILDNPHSRFGLPIIALAEACWIVNSGKTSIPSVSDFLLALDKDKRVTVLPMDRDTVNLSLTLTSVGEMHDRLIVASTLQLSKSVGPVALLTKDGNITASGTVQVIW